jgi:hypothetical protein
MTTKYNSRQLEIESAHTNLSKVSLKGQTVLIMSHTAIAKMSWSTRYITENYHGGGKVTKIKSLELHIYDNRNNGEKANNPNVMKSTIQICNVNRKNHRKGNTTGISCKIKLL